MKQIFLLVIVIITSTLHSQINSIIPARNTEDFRFENGYWQVRTLSGDENNFTAENFQPVTIQSDNPAGSMVRWSFLDAVAIADRNQTSGNGLYQTVGWGLNIERISLYGNTNSTPIWEFPTNPNTFTNYVAISDTGGYIASASYHNIYIFSRTSSTPIFDYNLETQLPDTGVASAIDITSNGSFIVSCASRNDSSWIMGFQRTSTIPVWRYRVGQTIVGGAGIYGIKISGNDSLVIVNTYLGVYVFRAFTGHLLFSGTVNSTNNNGTQAPQGISGNGNIIATINYIGFVRVLQWNDSTYTLLWQHQEPPGTYYNWMNTVDVSYDGNLVACGTLNFLTSSSYDGKVKLFRTATGSTPLWTFAGAGDAISCVAFSKNGNILAASSWGDFNHTTNDLMVFKVSAGVNVPIFQLNTPGSFFWCSASDNGSTVVASGKKVHARQFGNGGEVYNVFIDTNDSPLGIPGSKNQPVSFSLEQNYPNPFNPSTQIKYHLAKDEFVNIIIYDVLGKETAILVNKLQKRGNYSVEFNAEKLTSGVYFYKITAGDYTETKKMVILK